MLFERNSMKDSVFWPLFLKMPMWFCSKAVVKMHMSCIAGHLQGRDIAFLIGGPEGHSPEVLSRADEQWSIGALTLPHMLVRLVVAEQVYRAASLLANHPYHRA